jgi:filamentous hemagglutinin family protein
MFFRNVSLFLSTTCALALFANPQNGIVIEGNARFEGFNTAELTVYPSDKAIIHWDSFSISPQEVVRFMQASNDHAVLNRVMGKEISQLSGQLLANGKVFLINPQGILIGKEAVIDVGSFIATSFNISDTDFLTGKDLKFMGDSSVSLRNEGTIQARKGDIFLLAHRVENKGSLCAKEGKVLLGAGHEILVGTSDKNDLYVQIDALGDGLLNEGQIESFQTILESNPYSFGIQNQGDALRVEEQGGQIYLSCKGGSLQNQGLVTAPKGKIKVQAEDAHFENHHIMEAKEGAILISSFSEEPSLERQKRVGNYGKLDVSGTCAGTVAIQAPKFSSHGSILAEGTGGSISLFVPGSYIETADAHLSVNGENGKLQVLAGHYFSSGTISAKGTLGGSIDIESEHLKATAAHFDASGLTQGGQIKLNATSTTCPMLLNPHVVLNVSGQNPGTIQLLSSYCCQAPKDLPTWIDPNENEASLLWLSVSHLKKEHQEMAIKNWAFDGSGITLAACPADSVELIDPHASGANSSFGNELLALSSGNVVVTKSNDDSMTGAVYLYNASTGALLSSLFGSAPGDLVGSGTPLALANGNYVVRSPSWNASRGAITLGNGLSGVSGIVGGTNSLVGSSPGDSIGGGFGGVIALANGNYVVASPFWTSSLPNVGAVTFCNGVVGRVGTISAANSLVGLAQDDKVGEGILALSNGNYVVGSSNWANSGNASAGAITLVDGVNGLPVGPVSSSNSLVGGQANDQVGSGGVIELTNGNLVVRSPFWHNGANASAGAGTWMSRTVGATVGTVSASNSIVGSSANDAVDLDLIGLTNGNFVLGFSNWTNPSGPINSVGAVIWANGDTGLPVGTVSTLNSLVGTQPNDQVGSRRLVALAQNGNYVVLSQNWANGGNTQAGAVTWRSGSAANPDTVSVSNSFVGSLPNDHIGSATTPALANGNFVTSSPNWNGGCGAVTFGYGTSANPIGAVSSSNSLVGSNTSDGVGDGGIYRLATNHYVVVSPSWQNGVNIEAGAATWGDRASGVAGAVSISNSLVGSQAGDLVGGSGVAVLSNGNYVVGSSNWHDALTTQVGAATWCDGSTGTTGVVSAANSLVGSHAGDLAGNQIFLLSNGNYVVETLNWTNDLIPNAGALTWVNGSNGLPVGTISTANSLVGSQSADLTNAVLENLSQDEFIIYSPSWNGNTGAVTLANAANGTFCDVTYGPIADTNSFVGANINAGLGSHVVVSVGNGQSVTVVQFQDNNGQTKIFSIPKVSLQSSGDAKSFDNAIHDFAVVISEGFLRLSSSWWYAPFIGTFEGLRWAPASLVEEENSEREGFEPSVPLNGVRVLSRDVPSATQPSFHYDQDKS